MSVTSAASSTQTAELARRELDHTQAPTEPNDTAPTAPTSVDGVEKKVEADADATLKTFADKAGVDYKEPANHYDRVQLASKISEGLSAEERAQFTSAMEKAGAPAGLNFGLHGADGQALNQGVQLDHTGQQAQARFATEFAQGAERNAQQRGSATDSGERTTPQQQPAQTAREGTIPILAPVITNIGAFLPAEMQGAGETGIAPMSTEATA